ncbi:hypothetical protein PFISCL1PPCAC_15428 [Pristionchus fissidentatus]|uniref:Uncharacterized protein n=1 Tax=Pristionchus fissidentatus TaxID=1538716 RepID=A0AAV5VX66_9BILA|nr:hypothetical protein PFISCL1PPCAC_15428 [Pristionchus fissidentatus]
MERNASMRAASGRSIYEQEAPFNEGRNNGGLYVKPLPPSPNEAPYNGGRNNGGLYVKPFPPSPNPGYGLPPSPYGNNSESLRRSEVFTVERTHNQYYDYDERKAVHPFTYYTTGRRLIALVVVCGLSLVVIIALAVVLIASFT